MTSKRMFRLGVIGLVIALGAAVIPLTIAIAAPEKIYDLTIAPSALTGGTGVSLTATFRNATPTGNSTINSLSLNAPAGFTITGATGIATETVAPGGGSVSVTNIPPVKPGKTYVLNLTVNTPAADCTSTAHWAGPQGQGVTVWTGSSLSGDTFRFLPASSSVTTTVSDLSQCALRFVSGRSPADAVVNTIITSARLNPSGPPVQVELVDPDTGAVASSFTGPVKIDKTPDTAGPIGLTGNIVNAVGGVATFGALKATTPGAFRLRASAFSEGIFSAPSALIIIGEGTLGCPSIGSDTDTATDGAGAPTAVLHRFENVGGNPPCAFIPYVLETGTVGNKQFVDFIKNVQAQQTAQFTIKITWDPEVATYPVSRTTQVSGYGPNGDGAAVDLEWCEPSTTAGQLYDLPNPAVPWCLVTQSSTMDSPAITLPGFIQVTETVYGLGDPRIVRG
jgi:hypothetical protein